MIMISFASVETLSFYSILFYYFLFLFYESLIHTTTILIPCEQLEKYALERQIPSNLLHVYFFVLRILLNCDELSHPPRSLEETDEENETKNGIVEGGPRC